MTYFHIRNQSLREREMIDKKMSLLSIMSFVRMIQDQHLKEGQKLNAVDVAWMVLDYKEYMGRGIWDLVEEGYLRFTKQDGSTVRAGTSAGTGIASPIYYFYLTDKAIEYAKKLKGER